MIFNFKIIETKGQLPDGKYRYVKVQFVVIGAGGIAASTQIVSIGTPKGIELGLVNDFINDPLEVAKDLNLTASVSMRYMYVDQVYQNVYEFENGYVTKIVITPNKRNVTYYFENNCVSDFYPHKFCRYQRSTETFAFFISSRNKIVRLWVDRPWIDLMVDGKIQFGGHNLPDSFCADPPRKDIKFDHPFPLRDCYVTIAGVDYLPRKHNLTADDIDVVRFENMITKKDSK